MKKTLLTLAATFCYSLVAFAQAPPKKDCGTMQHHQYLKQTRPNYEADLIQYNQMLDQYQIDKAAGLNVAKTNNSAAIITIPVVVHVIYRVAAENISDAQAASQVTVLNNDFAKLNADASKVTQPTFSTVASGAQIRFCLAQRDPSGNPTTGVTHKTTTVTAFSTDDKVKSNATGGQTAWDVTKYVNIWVCNMGTTLLGYGEFPTGSLSNTWGLVLHYKYTGSGGTAVAPYNLGRTGTHEFGHCFNLLHIWGDDGTACTGSDQCADTPNQADEHYGPFTPGSIQTDGCTSTGSGVMWMNYMDYTDDGSMYMFTANQVARMEAVVNNSPWNVLASSMGCTPVSALDAGITSIIAPINGSSTCDNNVTPKITLNNAGSTTLTSATINYQMDATATQTLAWTGSLASATSTVITLNTYAGLTNAAHTFSVWVTSPNGGTDANSVNNSMSSTFTVIAAPVTSALPFVERFDAVPFPPTGWLKTSANVSDATATWTRLANTTGIPVVPTTTACAKMNNYAAAIDISGQIDALRTPALNFATANSTLKLKFDVSHRMYSTTDIDTLNVYISTDCGGTWTKLYTKGGAQLATVAGALTTAYTPTSNAQWRRDSLSLSAYAGQTNVYLKFESRSGYGNNLYLDNINVNYTPTVAPVASFTSSATKCSGSAIAFSDQSTNAPTSWNWSFPGATTTTATVQNPTATYTASGTYTVSLISANASGTSTPVSQTIAVNATPTVVTSNTTVCSGTPATLIATGATTYIWNTGATTSSISVTPTVTTYYTVTGNTTGCANTKSVSVTVNPKPTVVANSATICSGTSTVLTASGAISYNWNTGETTNSISVTPTITTNYSVVGTNTFGCTNTKTVSVTVNSAPTVVVNSPTVCSGTSTVLTASGATTYSWNTGDNTSSISVTQSVTTIYTVTGTVGGCSNTTTVSLVVDNTCADVWPGDANSDGIADNLDVLELGLHYTLTGAPRATTSNAWQSYFANNWVGIITNGKNLSHSDCNGDGIINDDDTLSIFNNYGLTHAFKPAQTTTVNPQLSIVPDQAMVTKGNWGSSSVYLGDATTNINNINGVAFTVDFDNTLIEPTNIYVEYQNSFIDVSQNLHFRKLDFGNGKIFTATTHTVNNNVSGFGKIATLHYQIKSSLTTDEVLNIGIVQANQSDASGLITPLTSGAGTLLAVGSSVGIKETLNSSSISVYPNPAKDAITISMDASLINHATIELYDATGKLVITEKVVNTNTAIIINSLAKGIYTVRVVSDGNQMTKRIIKE